MLPVSKPAETILQRIFTIFPDDCIDLPTLRQLIEDIDTFYMSDEELAHASSHAVAVYMAYQPPPSLEENDESAGESESIMESISLEDGDTGSLVDDSDDSNEHSNGITTGALLRMEEGPLPKEPFSLSDFSSENRPHVHASQHESQAQGVFTLGSDGHSTQSQSQDAPEAKPEPLATSSTSSHRDTSSRSADTSGEPLTPETRAQDPAIVVPDLPESEGMDMGLGLAIPVAKDPVSHLGVHIRRPILVARTNTVA